MKLVCIASSPRLGFLSHWRCQEQAFVKLGIQPKRYDGPGWEIGIDCLMGEAIKDGADYVLTVDYDSIFEASHIEELIRLAEAYPDADAIIPLQAKRGENDFLFVIAEADGRRRFRVDVSEFAKDLTKVDTGHFGLTLIKCTSLAKLPKPWLWSQPDANGGWGDGKKWCDIYFWEKAREAGWGIYLANNVRLGHLEEVIRWPTREFTIIEQMPHKFFRDGAPEETKGPVEI